MMKHLTTLAVAGMSLLAATALAPTAEAAAISAGTFNYSVANFNLNSYVNTPGMTVKSYVKFVEAPPYQVSPDGQATFGLSFGGWNTVATYGPTLSWSGGSVAPASGSTSNLFLTGPNRTYVSDMGFNVTPGSIGNFELNVWVTSYGDGVIDFKAGFNGGAPTYTSQYRTVNAPTYADFGGFYNLKFNTTSATDVLNISVAGPADNSAWAFLGGANLTTAVPEPASLALLGLGTLALLRRRRSC
jgi:hypothetical protein